VASDTQYLADLRSRFNAGEAFKYVFFWGHQLAHDDERAKDPNAWLGLNLLGFALMQVREAL